MSIKSKKGLTLVELIISITLTSLIILTTISILDFGQKSFVSLENSGEMQTVAENVLQFITYQIRGSKSINNVSAGKIEYVNNKNENISLVLENGKLKYSNLDTGEKRELTDKASAVEFNLDGDIVKIRLELSSGQDIYKVGTAVYRRSR